MLRAEDKRWVIFIEQGEYELLFGEYNSIEETPGNTIDAFINAISVNRRKIYISFSTIPITAVPYGELLVMLKRRSDQR